MKKILGILLSTALLFGCTARGANEATVSMSGGTALSSQVGSTASNTDKERTVSGDWEYYENAKGITLTRCYAKTDTVTAPQKINGKPVTQIETDAYLLETGSGFFKSKKVKNFILSDSITNVEFDAFGCDQLESIFLGKRVSTLTVTSATADEDEHYLPLSLERISVSPDNKNFKTVDGVLYNKEMTVLYAYPPAKQSTAFTVPKTVNQIRHHAFASAVNLTKIELPQELASLEKFAFSECENLSGVTLNSKLQHIGLNALKGTPFRKKLFKNSVENKLVYWNDILIGCSGIVPKTVKVKEGTRLITLDVFYEQDQMKTLILPDSIEVLEAEFQNCSNLQTIQFGNKIRSIDNWAFAYTPFWNNYLDRQGELLYHNGILFGCKSCFTDRENYPKDVPKEISVKAGTRVIANYAFEDDGYNTYKMKLSKVILPNGLEAIGTRAFYGCKELKKLTIPKSVTYIGEDAFLETDIEFTVYKNSYAHKYLKKNGFKKIIVKS